MSESPEYQRPGFVRRWGTRVLAVIGAFTLLAVVVLGAWAMFRVDMTKRQVRTDQETLEPFYTPPDPLPKEPGTLIRSEVVNDVALQNATTYRVLYASRNPANEPVAVGGLVFVPNGPPPKGERRKVVAWAHPTVGLADQCAPSRASNPLMDTSGWLQTMLNRGWVVTATDYYGLGTPGPKSYLIGQQEAKDVVFSVKAAQHVPGSGAGNDWIVWGHSQGGHASLWTAALAREIAPELNLVGVGAAAPAQQLLTIIEKQWPDSIGWVIGVEAVVSFQEHYPDFQVMDSLTPAGRNQLEAMDSECLVMDIVRGTVLSRFVGPFFNTDPLGNPQIVMIAEQQTPPTPPRGMPMFMSEGTKDKVVLGGANAAMQEQWCRAGVEMRVEWLGDVGHMEVANASGPAFVEWAASRFEGRPNVANCAFPPPVPPIPTPVVAPDVQRQADELLKTHPLPQVAP